MIETLGPIPIPHKLGMVVYSCNPTTNERETGRSEFKVTLDYIVNLMPDSERLCLKRKKKKSRTSKMTQQVKTLVTKWDNLSSTPYIIMEGEKLYPTSAYVHTQVCTQ